MSRRDVPRGPEPPLPQRQSSALQGGLATEPNPALVKNMPQRQRIVVHEEHMPSAYNNLIVNQRPLSSRNDSGGKAVCATRMKLENEILQHPSRVGMPVLTSIVTQQYVMPHVVKGMPYQREGNYAIGYTPTLKSGVHQWSRRLSSQTQWDRTVIMP
jgi:hypothetical protein